MLTFSDASTFLKHIRPLIGGAHHSSDKDCFNEALKIVNWYCAQ